MCNFIPFLSFFLALWNNFRFLNVKNLTMIAWFLFFSGPTRWSLSIVSSWTLSMISSGISTSASSLIKFLHFFQYIFACFLFFLRYISNSKTSSAAIRLIIVNRKLKLRIFFRNTMLLFIKELTCFWSKLTVEETFSGSLNSSLIMSLVSSLKISFRLDLICSINTSLNSSNFACTAALNSLLLLNNCSKERLSQLAPPFWREIFNERLPQISVPLFYRKGRSSEK